MNIAQSIWASVQAKPVLMKRANYGLAVFWLLMTWPAIHWGWINSVGFLGFLSIYSIVCGHLSTAQAAAVEVRQEEIHEEDKAEHS